MKNNKISYLLLAILSLCLIIFSTRQYNENKYYESKIQEQIKSIDSLIEQNQSLIKQRDELNKKRGELNSKKRYIDAKIKELNKETDEKINSIYSMPVDSLDLYLTNYRDINRTKI
jgi:septal ring factor EnvC (AmiA/AmiB activator)